MPQFTFTRSRKPWNNAAKRAYELIEEWCTTPPEGVTTIHEFALSLQEGLTNEVPKWTRQLSIELGSNRLFLNRPNSTEGAAMSVKHEEDTEQT